MNTTSLLKLGLVLCLGGGLTLATTTAEPLAYDGFESYTTGQALDGDNGGTGWQGAWSSVAEALVADVSGDSLSYSGGTFSVDGGNNAVSITDNSTGYFVRQYDGIGTGVDDDELFFSFLFRQESGTGGDFLNFWTSDNGDRNNSGGIGDQSTTNPVFGARVRGAGDSTDLSSFSYVAGETYLLVGRFSRDGTSGDFTDPLRFDLMQLWVNPTTTDYGSLGTPTAEIDASSGRNGGFQYFGLRTVNLGTGEEYLIDELRFATDYQSVIGVPEPTSAALLLGAFGLLALRRRR